MDVSLLSNIIFSYPFPITTGTYIIRGPSLCFAAMLTIISFVDLDLSSVYLVVTNLVPFLSSTRTELVDSNYVNNYA